MAGRGPQSFKKRQREQLRKEKQEEKRAKRVERKAQGPVAEEELEGNPLLEELQELDAADIADRAAGLKSASDLAQ